MKKITTIILCSIAMINAYSQAEDQGAILITAGTGFGIYTSETNFASDSGKTSGAVPGLLNISVGYAITDDLSAGVSFERAGFITNKEDSSKVTALNPSIYVAYNIVNNDKFTFYAKADYGMSMLDFQSEKVESLKKNITIKSNSWAKVNLNLGIKKYFSDSIGMFFSAGYGVYKYGEIVVNNDAQTPSEQILKKDGTANDDVDNATITMSGVNIRTGLTFLF